MWLRYADLLYINSCNKTNRFRKKTCFQERLKRAIRHTVVFVWFSHFFFEKEHDYFSRLKQRKHFIIMPKRYPCFWDFRTCFHVWSVMFITTHCCYLGDRYSSRKNPNNNVFYVIPCIGPAPSPGSHVTKLWNW